MRICLTWVTFSTRLFIMFTHPYPGGKPQFSHIAFIQFIQVLNQKLLVDCCIAIIVAIVYCCVICRQVLLLILLSSVRSTLLIQ